ncbi:MAG TPA: OmpA family protein [Acetobacteraceae bacterium]|nr:OmpA family protein [Acetobacteraceae bacterium]
MPLVCAAGVALSAASFAVRAEGNANEGYWTEGSGIQVWKNASGLCWRGGSWTPAMANAECDPELMPKTAAAEAPPAAPAPAPAARPRPMAEKVTLAADVLFDFDRAVIKPAGEEQLDALAGEIRNIELEVVIAIGHTDRIGSADYNMRLSERRAASVKDYLVSKGIEPDRIHTEGKGETQPVKSCPDHMKSRKALIECLAPNRRVEIEVIGTRKQ